jgi:hypothetical protein
MRASTGCGAMMAKLFCVDIRNFFGYRPSAFVDASRPKKRLLEGERKLAVSSNRSALLRRYWNTPQIQTRRTGKPNPSASNSAPSIRTTPRSAYRKSRTR